MPWQGIATTAGRLREVRVRRLGLRLIGLGLVGAWGLAAALILSTYRPGGPLDVIVGITMLVPVGMAPADQAARDARGHRRLGIRHAAGVAAIDRGRVEPAAGAGLTDIAAVARSRLPMAAGADRHEPLHRVRSG